MTTRTARTARPPARPVRAAGHRIEIRDGCAVVDGAVKPLPPALMALLRALATRPGAVISGRELLRVLPGDSADTHAVEVAVLRLRSALGDRNIVRTIVKRGYRLSVDEPVGAP